MVMQNFFKGLVIAFEVFQVLLFEIETDRIVVIGSLSLAAEFCQCLVYCMFYFALRKSIVDQVLSDP